MSEDGESPVRSLDLTPAEVRRLNGTVVKGEKRSPDRPKQRPPASMDEYMRRKELMAGVTGLFRGPDKRKPRS